MAEEASKAGVDFWGELEEAEQTVDEWPAWQRQYQADVHYEEDTSK